MKYDFFSDVKNGRLSKSAADQISKCLQSFEGNRVEISIQKKTSQRSDKQNRYLHALFTIFKNELNGLGNEFTSIQVKDLCKCKFLTYDEVNKETGEVIGKNIRETHKLNKMEMMEFIENIIRWGAELSIILPYPNEEMQINFEE